MDPVLHFALAAIVIAVGLVGTVLPFVPGVPLVFAGLFYAAWAQDFTRVGWVGLVVIGALMVIAFIVEIGAGALGAKRVGASGLALLGATIGALVGIFFGVPGLLIGPFAGAVAGELIATGGLVQAGKVGVGTWIGFLLAAIAKLVIAFLMIATYLAFYFAAAIKV